MEKSKKYEILLSQVAAMIDGETAMTGVLANVAALLHETFDWLWTGFYTAGDDDTLHLGPFQGPVACYRIKKGRGVCGTAWERDETLVVPDVEAFPGHIACSGLSRSEIVVPIHDADNNVVAVLDIDSASVATFDDVDKNNLEKVAQMVGATINWPES